MDVLFFVLSAAGFSIGTALIVLVLHPGSGDPGTRSLAIPLSLLALVTALELLSAYLGYRYPDRSFRVLTVLYEWAMIGIAIGWTHIAYYHYSLNGVAETPRGRMKLVGGTAAVLAVATIPGVYWIPEILTGVRVIVIAGLYFAGFKGVLIVRRTNELLPSSRVAVAVAALSLVVYPLIAIGDVIGWRLPFLDPRLTLWIQAHPIYVMVVYIPVTVYVVRHHLRRAASTPRPGVAPDARALLTDREAEVLDLLCEGRRYREIAEELFVSMPTVKTHVQHIYQKLGVRRREELFLLVQTWDAQSVGASAASEQGILRI